MPRINRRRYRRGGNPLRLRAFDPDATISLAGAGLGMAAGAALGATLFDRNFVTISGQSIITDSVLSSGSSARLFDYTDSQNSYGQDVVTQYDNARLKEIITQINPDTEEGRKLLEILRNTSPERLKQNIKAAELVKQWLTPEEYKMLKEKHKVVVNSKIYKGREYHVPENPSERVVIYENGRRVAALCGIVYTDRETRQEFAYGDKLLTKVMAIKNDEGYYIRNSNVYNYGDEELNGGRWVIHNHQALSARREMTREMFGGAGLAIREEVPHNTHDVSLRTRSRHNENETRRWKHFWRRGH